MPRNQITKDEIKNEVLRCKYELYEEDISHYLTDPKKLAHKYLNRVLDKIEEYRI